MAGRVGCCGLWATQKSQTREETFIDLVGWPTVHTDAYRKVQYTVIAVTFNSYQLRAVNAYDNKICTNL